jgi:hypothetical protein
MTKPPDLAHLAASHPPELVWRIVCGLSTTDDWIDAAITRWIDPRRILARPWNAGRLDRARRLLASGDVAPPIVVIGYRLGRAAAIYECDDGIHRTVAARDAGRRVKARIKGYYQLRPQTFVLYKEHLWRPHPSQPGCLCQVVAVSTDMRPLLHALGVNAWPLARDKGTRRRRDD